MNIIYAVQQYTFEDWNVSKWFDSLEQANTFYQEMCAKYPQHQCFYKIKEIFNDALGNNFRFFNINQSNKG